MILDTKEACHNRQASFNVYKCYILLYYKVNLSTFTFCFEDSTTT